MTELPGASEAELLIIPDHFANTSMEYRAIFHGCKNVQFQMKSFNVFLILAQNIDCGYTLEPPHGGGGGSN